MITHFFNPPRYMRLLELVASPETQSEFVKGIGQFADQRLGKGCVKCKDTPGSIANRIGFKLASLFILINPGVISC
ncbi:MAG: 3-hydroxyacyl-CoA dehydrogenase NAD-binding domain-containing protein [Methylococcales bacterium]